MSNDLTNSRRPTSRLADLAKRIKQSTTVKKIVEIPQDRFVCRNPFHGKIKTVHSFFNQNEIECDCGIIYRRAK